MSGDSYVLQITSDRLPKETEDGIFIGSNPNFNSDTQELDRPYVKILEEHQSLA
jgi:hypothetical protein